jgi:NodT family efflux transporter outer membrane factor (OMF) lipoprotein
MIPLDQQSLSLIAIRMKKRTTVSKMVFRLHQISAAVFVAGCSVGPRYRQPLLKLQPYQNAPAVGSLSAGLSVPPLDIWREGFNNPTLTKIVERALAQNLDLAASFARVEQARAAAQEAGANRKPSFDLPGSDAASRRSVATPIGRAESGVLPGFNRNQNVVDLGIGASWEADVFGGLRWGSEAANAEAQAAEAERFGARVSVVAKAADAYLQIRGTQVRLAFAKEQIETNEHLQQLVLQRKNAGLASERELAQAEALLSQARATIPQLQIILEAQMNRLDVLTGAQPGTYASELNAPKDIPAVTGIANTLDAADLLRRRPDIIAAERRLEASNARIGQVIAEYYPKISLSDLLGSEAETPGSLFREAGFQPALVAGLRWRLFDFGRVDAEVKQARGANAEALVQYRSSVLRATEDLEDSLNALAQSESRRDEIAREIGSLQRAKDLSQQSYEAGEIPLTDVLDANRQLLAAKDDLASSRETAARAAVSSFRALGGGWTPKPILRFGRHGATSETKSVCLAEDLSGANIEGLSADNLRIILTVEHED